jgi:tripartite-type tricarboxylate transporter receptor subunit TctC
MKTISGSRLRGFAGCLSLSICAGSPAIAQSYPTKAIQAIIPFAAGASTDVVYRMIAPGLSERMGQPVLIINRAGGAATIGMNAVAKSAPDGYTLGVATLSFAANPPFMVGQMPFDTEKDLVPVVMTTRVPLVMEIHPSVPARSVRELIELARAKPGAVNYGSSGVASSGHLAAALFESMAGVQMTHVPYSNQSSISGLVAGVFEVLFGAAPNAVPLIKSGRLVALGVTTAKPIAQLPGVPPVAETVPGFEVTEWAGLVAPTGTPGAIIGRIQQDVVRTLAEPELARRVEGTGALIVAGSTEDFARHLKQEFALWNKVGARVKAGADAKR